MEKALSFLKRYYPVLIFLAVVLVGVGGYAYGYRFSTDGLVRAGTLVITDVPEGTQVFTDETRMTLSSGGVARVDLLPGTHSVIVAAPEMQPWNELATVSSGSESVLTPVLIPVAPTARILTGEERARGADAILAYTLPTKVVPLRMAGGCALVYVANNRIVADATTTPECVPPPYLLCPLEEGGVPTEPCPSSTVIFPPNERLESVSVMPGRDDVLVIGAGSLGYVVELDPRQPQFFAPILKGERVRAAPWTEDAIVISDTKKVYELPL